jgi:uncharacterized membrane protein SpoIIM required for sporulation
LGLLLFSGTIFCGLLSGSSAEAMALRAVLALGGGFLVGAVAGWIGLMIVKDDAAARDSESAKAPRMGEGTKIPQAASVKG